MAHEWLTSIFSTIQNRHGWVLKSIPESPTANATGVRCRRELLHRVARRGKTDAFARRRTVFPALEAQRIKLAELAATEVGILQRYKPPLTPEPEPMRLSF